ncbi:hypothetical protein PSENEW3_00001217 [Picochlorum sp. SENEW3]|nr:hypothetical protein PSENEW3_00001217 [Picochlorum sp. SENEW3]
MFSVPKCGGTCQMRAVSGSRFASFVRTGGIRCNNYIDTVQCARYSTQRIRVDRRARLFSRANRGEGGALYDHVVENKALCAVQNEIDEKHIVERLFGKEKRRVLSALMALVACGVMDMSTLNMPAAAAEYDSTTYEQMQSKAKPFKKQEVNKGRIWLLFVLGASSLFGVTVLVENNSAWFPAIAKANKAMQASMKAMEEQEKLAAMQLLENEIQEKDRLENAVLAGIQQASSDARQTLQKYKEGIPREIEAEDIEEESPSFEEQKPLFEISGDDIDKSIEDKMESTHQAVDEEEPQEDVADSSDMVDLSAISLEELQKELEMRQKKSS